MGSSSGGLTRKKYNNVRNRQRANMSFFLVIMFFAVFGIIVFTEIFLIAEKGRGSGVLVGHGSMTYHHRQRDRSLTDYEDNLQSDDYISMRSGNSIGTLFMGRPVQIPVIESELLPQSSNNVLTESQLPPYPTYLTPALDGTWQTVNGTQFKFFVFSAFHDDRKGQKAVRVIGATKTRGPERVWCRFWYRSNSNGTVVTSKSVQAKIKVIRENWNLRYSACFILCPLPGNQTVPDDVSIVPRMKATPTNLLHVNTYQGSKENAGRNFGVCIKPLHFDFNKTLQILEFIELNRIMGVSHFTFYNHTIGPQVSCILQDYIDAGVITMLPWQLNMLSQKEIRTEGLFAALNDCLYRSMYKYSHVLFIDLDEFIVPRYNDTLPDLIGTLDANWNHRFYSSYSFQNAFFYLQWGDDDSVYDTDDPIAANLVTLKKTRRRSKLHPHKQRSKYICRPDLVVEVGNHFVWEFIPGHGTMNVKPDAAILHHYRICEFGGDDCVKTASDVDRTALKYRDRLVEKVTSRFMQYKNECKLMEPPPPPTRVLSKIMSILKSRQLTVKL